MIKLKMGNQVRWEETRSGWNYVIDILSALNDDKGILFDGSLDHSFGYASDQKKEKGVIPYAENWIGFLHSTVSLCPFLHEFLTLDQIISSKYFLESLENCKGIFTLSGPLAGHIREKLDLNIPVENLKHPTEFAEYTFDLQRFSAEKKIIHVGAWLRKITSFVELRAAAYKKILLFNYSTQKYFERELNYYDKNNFDHGNIEIVQRLPDQEYDQLLAESVVFLNFCDCGVSNTVIECIVRNTPLLVNKLEPLVEYLGKDYPFYYSSLENAAEKLSDINIINETYNYLKNFPGKNELSREYFLDSFLNSKIIKALQ